jgi:hypothetical protein
MVLNVFQSTQVQSDRLQLLSFELLFRRFAFIGTSQKGFGSFGGAKRKADRRFGLATSCSYDAMMHR